MDAFPVIWGLDIGHSTLKAVKLARSGPDVIIQGYAIEPIARGEDVDRDMAVLDSLKALVEREEMHDAPVVVALSGRQIFTKTINVPVLNQNKIGRMVELEARQQIPGDFNDVEWDYHLSPSIDGASYDVTLFAARRELVHNLVTLCDAADLQLAGVSVSSLAVYNFVNYDQEFEEEESVVILDVGAENTDLVVYQDDHLWIRNLAFSGNDITHAFEKKFRVSFEEAEKLKMEVNDSRQAERIMKVVEASLGDLTSDVQRSLGFYKSQNPDANFENVVVSGNTFRMEALSSYLANKLGYPIITLVELDRIEVHDSLEREQFAHDVQSLSTAIGLALEGVGAGTASVNLLPKSIRLQALLKTKRWAAIAALILIAIAFIVTYSIKSTRAADYAEWKNQVTTVQDQLAEGEAPVQALVDKIVPQAQEMASYRTFGQQKGHIQSIQQGIIVTLQSIAQNPEFTLDPPNKKPINGGDPVTQPIFLDAIKIPELALNENNIFTPDTSGRIVEIVVLIHSRASNAKIVKTIAEKLTDLKIGKALQHVNGLDATHKVFVSVNSASEESKDIRWRYRQDNFVGVDGGISHKLDQNTTRYTAMTFVCELNSLKPQPKVEAAPPPPEEDVVEEEAE